MTTIALHAHRATLVQRPFFPLLNAFARLCTAFPSSPRSIMTSFWPAVEPSSSMTTQVLKPSSSAFSTSLSEVLLPLERVVSSLSYMYGEPYKRRQGGRNVPWDNHPFHVPSSDVHMFDNVEAFEVTGSQGPAGRKAWLYAGVGLMCCACSRCWQMLFCDRCSGWHQRPSPLR
ncbi:hypothetical protein K466DRAFT_580194 [Polyporus arcularius HHB13444]|uniref:Uncharacterized protein n=1 Tax=Polyporus arcularius HHB13444 TaxID=1314778 RepID=A0A5C3Q224_9APHY|nr:hypothetical protein K466DRAFT_580194 [Polyporus arcularius HHB13444]